ncbi:guanylate cyclase activator 2B [Mustela nigripes]|uniref:Guanylate cyclase activator 2B n=2 Tax=Mustela putorius furo TaxID=9669 RepID=A0A8U0MGS6_MUSPF|nr:guanylate cyclase activator 2B isoform X2 [Mustela putorius furo]XP_059232411.1 guanylate cyclase activator 2B [Mustela nigripes]
MGYRRSEMSGRMVSGLLPRVAVVFLLLLQDTHSVSIQHQGFRVQLESVKKLRDLEEQRGPNPTRVSRLQAQSLVPSVCHHPALPLDLQPVCTSKEAASVLQALKSIANDDCELCVNVACTGCL